MNTTPFDLIASVRDLLRNIKTQMAARDALSPPWYSEQHQHVLFDRITDYTLKFNSSYRLILSGKEGGSLRSAIFESMARNGNSIYFLNAIY